MQRGAAGIGERPSRKHELLSAPALFLTPCSEALWSWSDPSPYMREMRATIAEAFRWLFAGMARKFVPRRLRMYSQINRRLIPEARPAYIRLRLRDALRLGSGAPPTLPSEARSFVFVCFGNLMRSPMAEAMLKRALAEHGIDDVEVKSAGIHAKAGREAHEWAIAAGHELGIPLDQHRAEPLTADMVSGSDVLFAMDYANVVELISLYPEAKGKIFLLSGYAEGSARNREIPDPYFGDLEQTRKCYSLVKECIDRLASEIAGSHRHSAGVAYSTSQGSAH